MIIRPEERRDWGEVENLTREAFWNVYRPGCDEHLVLHNMRSDESFIPELDYVIEEDGKIVANIVYAWGKVALDAGGEMPMALFGPISVLPGCQKMGYGSAIIRHTLGLAKEMGLAAVTITGNPAYYHRFGFESGSKHGVYYSEISRDEEGAFFMINVLDPDKMRGISGTYYEPAVYRVGAEELAAFDAKFPPKVKEVRPGQL